MVIISNPYGGLRQQLNNMKQEERQHFSERVATALRARTTKKYDTAVVKAKAWTKLNGEIYTEGDAVFHTGCIHPIATKAVTDGKKRKRNRWMSY